MTAASPAASRAPAREVSATNAGGVAAGQLRSYVDRLERLEEEIDELQNDKRDVYAEVKGAGFDVAIVRRVLRKRRQDPAERQEEEALLDLYLHALGMTPGGDGD